MVSVDEIVLSCALRYALGRHTYITATVADNIKAVWSKLSQHTQLSLEKDLVQHVEGRSKVVDTSIDLKVWNDLLNFIKVCGRKPTSS